MVRERSDTVSAEPQALRQGEAGLRAIDARPRPRATRGNARRGRSKEDGLGSEIDGARSRAERDPVTHAPADQCGTLPGFGNAITAYEVVSRRPNSAMAAPGRERVCGGRWRRRRQNRYG